ncbi:uncharacterized protein K02A2.6-like [Nylanderia fulva]|uniref:uncharacterized protein K02A2.6-like n=1 Tax=Nylanderia fulva TaxID=613905 RepID=UPI0010FB8D33|nr:uncharacterized protein K02A2.6-like [Nylanderia fulva]XP_029179192.1 uncharacterized protein K02A2.6-like [Nylanderia fulva]XP_029179193.1 uncharacterized protein K02A2.6-like [Nylanderia fulva]XP_029179194.1 uncharacterized protein K02A2.6-like [Nylanderia fulva]XP_029179195.1 uncharacterized protein K02A2.6-like [Nylanderia fulva]
MSTCKDPETSQKPARTHSSPGQQIPPGSSRHHRSSAAVPRIYQMTGGHFDQGHQRRYNAFVDAFHTTWISRFGAPATVTTDRGSQFESRLFQALIQLIGAHRTRTTAYHPSSNGMVERFHRSLKSAIRCHASIEWVDILPTVLLGLRASVKEDLKTSAAELDYGTPIRLPGEFFIDEDPPEDPQIFIEKLRKFMRKIRPTPPAHHIRPRVFSINTSSAVSMYSFEWTPSKSLSTAPTKARTRLSKEYPIEFLSSKSKERK